MDIDISNDPEIERLGANATAQHAIMYWKNLTEAARRDGRLLDPIWHTSENEDNDDGDADDDDDEEEKKGEQESKEHIEPPSAHYTTQIVLTRSAEEDLKLYRRFRSNFSFLNLENVKSTKTCNPLGGDRWASLLNACNGQMEDFNFMSLLREDVNQMFWMTENDVCGDLIVTPRAQFVFVELSRIHESLYGKTFRRMLCLFDLKTQGEKLVSALTIQNELEVSNAINHLHLQWPCPSKWALKESYILKHVRAGAKNGFSNVVRQGCQDLLQYWQDLLNLGRIPSNLRTASDETCHLMPALEKAGRALVTVQSSITRGNTLGIFDDDDASTRRNFPRTQTTSNIVDVTLRSTAKPAVSTHIFRTYGMCVFENLVEERELNECRAQASKAFDALVNEQLTPRGLFIDGENEFDFAEVRQRPGHRVDHRYKILDDPSSPIASLSRKLVRILPKLLTNAETDGYKLVYGGIVHAFPRKTESDPFPPPQLWHRDGPSLFDEAHHGTHCFNIFIPLVDLTTENGTTELVPGTQNDEKFHDILPQLLNLSQKDSSLKHELAVRAEVSAGTAIVFDVRVAHRGLSNTSPVDRPMLYFTIAKDWWVDKYMFGKKSLVEQNREDNANQTLTRQLYMLLTGHAVPDTDQTSYGHPHYTLRFDLLLMEAMASSDAIIRNAATKNIAAVLSFVAANKNDKESMACEFVNLLRDGHVQKRQALKEAKDRRKKHRRAADLLEDFTSIATDMSDVAILYTLVAKMLLEESVLLKKLGFSKDQDGICVLLALLKAYASCDNSDDKTSNNRTPIETLEESFTAWWHAGDARFTFHKDSCVTEDERSKRMVLVVFSSLGSGIARPEWNGSITNVAPSNNLDLLWVMDPAFSWYNQDPSCQWQGGDYYSQELKRHLRGYQRVFFLGDSMGAAAALRFSSLADNVLAFTPQVDISKYPAITRLDFPSSVRNGVRCKVIDAVKQASADITIHYGDSCEEDTKQIAMLPVRDNVHLIKHDFDDHTLSLHLREKGTLQEIVENAILKFQGKTRATKGWDDGYVYMND